MPIFQIITPYPGTQMYQNYKEKGLITNENREKYNALHLIIKSDRYEPLLFQHKVLKSYTGVYSWKHIIARTVYNPKKLINLEPNSKRSSMTMSSTNRCLKTSGKTK